MKKVLIFILVGIGLVLIMASVAGILTLVVKFIAALFGFAMSWKIACGIGFSLMLLGGVFGKNNTIQIK